MSRAVPSPGTPIGVSRDSLSPGALHYESGPTLNWNIMGKLFSWKVCKIETIFAVMCRKFEYVFFFLPAVIIYVSRTSANTTALETRDSLQ